MATNNFFLTFKDTGSILNAPHGEKTVVNSKIIARLTFVFHLPFSQSPFNIQRMFKVEIRKFFCSVKLFLLASHHWWTEYATRVFV